MLRPLFEYSVLFGQPKNRSKSSFKYSVRFYDDCSSKAGGGRGGRENSRDSGLDNGLDDSLDNALDNA